MTPLRLTSRSECVPIHLRTAPVPRRARRRITKGMTLVEILAVVVILGLIAGTLLYSFSGTFGKAKHELAKSGMQVVESMLNQYKIVTGRFPGNDAGLTVLTDGSATPQDPYYLKPSQLKDPWGNRYLYITPGPNGHPYEIISYGADGQPGGTPGSENADLSSAQIGENS